MAAAAAATAEDDDDDNLFDDDMDDGCTCIGDNDDIPSTSSMASTMLFSQSLFPFIDVVDASSDEPLFISASCERKGLKANQGKEK